MSQDYKLSQPWKKNVTCESDVFTNILLFLLFFMQIQTGLVWSYHWFSITTCLYKLQMHVQNLPSFQIITPYKHPYPKSTHNLKPTFTKLVHLQSISCYSISTSQLAQFLLTHVMDVNRHMVPKYGLQILLLIVYAVGDRRQHTITQRWAPHTCYCNVVTYLEFKKQA